MKYFISIGIIFLLLFLNCNSSPDMSQWQDIPQSKFLQNQLEFPRVREAFQQKKLDLKKMLSSNHIYSFEFDIFFRVFKKEEQLEVWVKPNEEGKFKLLKTYDFCKNSGKLGPKRKEGDHQIPEGFYRISHYNPKSNFLLSLKVNYPNASDKILSDQEKPGDDIYIHGGCQTVGCIPITDDKIQEVYLLSVLAKREGLSIPIHIFPFRMTKNNLSNYSADYPQYNVFWKSLKPGYDSFQKHFTLPNIQVLPTGQYYLGSD